jgi:hypothetical protein
LAGPYKPSKRERRVDLIKSCGTQPGYKKKIIIIKKIKKKNKKKKLINAGFRNKGRLKKQETKSETLFPVNS